MAPKRRKAPDTCLYCSRDLKRSCPCPGCKGLLCCESCYKKHAKDCDHFKSSRAVAKVLQVLAVAGPIYVVGFASGWWTGSVGLAIGAMAFSLFLHWIAYRLVPRPSFS